MNQQLKNFSSSSNSGYPPAILSSDSTFILSRSKRATYENISFMQQPYVTFGMVSNAPINRPVFQGDQRRYIHQHIRRKFSASNTSKATRDKQKRISLKDDIFAALGVGAIFSAAVFTPTIIDHMKQSDNLYKEFEVDDAIFHEMKNIQEELRSVGHNIDGLGNERKKAENQTVGILAAALNSDALQKPLASLFASVIASPQFQNSCQQLVKNLWNDLIQDPETTAQVIQLLNTAIQDEKIKKSFKELILTLLKDEEIYEELTSLVVRIGDEEQILDATKALLTESAHKAMSDPEILDHSMEFATDVVGDDVVQRTSGEALRNTVTYAVRPSLSAVLSIFGLGLLFVSASAVGNARSSAREGKDIDVAASIVAKRLGQSIFHFIFGIISFPGKIISTIASTTVHLVLVPIKVIGMRATILGSTISDCLFRTMARIASIPSSTAKSISILMLRLGHCTKHFLIYTMSPFLSFYGYLLYTGVESMSFVHDCLSRVSMSLSSIKLKPPAFIGSVSYSPVLSDISSMMTYLWHGISWSSRRLYYLGAKLQRSLTSILQFIIRSWVSPTV